MQCQPRQRFARPGSWPPTKPTYTIPPSCAQPAPLSSLCSLGAASCGCSFFPQNPLRLSPAGASLQKRPQKPASRRNAYSSYSAQERLSYLFPSQHGFRRLLRLTVGIGKTQLPPFLLPRNPARKARFSFQRAQKPVCFRLDLCRQMREQHNLQHLLQPLARPRARPAPFRRPPPL